MFAGGRFRGVKNENEATATKGEAEILTGDLGFMMNRFNEYSSLIGLFSAELGKSYAYDVVADSRSARPNT